MRGRRWPGLFCRAASTTAGTLRFQWQFNNVDLPGQTNDFLWLANVASNQASGLQYRAVLQDDQGGQLSGRAPLYVGDLLRPDHLHPATTCRYRVAALGDDVIFTVVASTSLTNLYYQWEFNGTNLDGETSHTHEIYPVTTNDAISTR